MKTAVFSLITVVFFFLFGIKGQAQNTLQITTASVTSSNQAQQLLKNTGLDFTPNKGQIADSEGNLRPDILYNTDNIYLRKTGISYVFNNIAEVMHEVHEKVEEIEHSEAGLGDKTEKELEEELLQQEIIKVHRVDMDFEGCNSNITVNNQGQLQGYNNYYYGHCPEGVLGVNQYQEVNYQNIYDGINIRFYGISGGNGMEYDMIVQPHADPNQINLRWKGTENIHINEQGHLIIKTPLNEFTESIPKVYQDIDGEIVDVAAKYVLNPISDNEAMISFSLAAFNAEYPLIIDPWVTYYGGNDTDYGYDIATDNSGNVVITGQTQGTAFPANNAGAPNVTWQGVYGGGFGDAFVAKFDANGNRLWSTYYGGSSNEEIFAIATDNTDNVVIAGRTQSFNFPVGNAGAPNVTWQAAKTPGPPYPGDVFVIKFDANGSRLWSTFYGLGNNMNIATDNSGNVVISGHTGSGFPVGNAGAPNVTFQGVWGGGNDAFVVKFDPNGNRLWATYYGGDQNEGFYTTGGEGAIATDNAGNVVITRMTKGGTFPVGNAGAPNVTFQGTYSGANDAFVVKFDPNGNRLWATYYGGSSDDIVAGIATDNVGNVVITGQTFSNDFPVGNAGAPNVTWQGTINGSYDAFIVKFDANGNQLWSTFLGGATSRDYGLAVAIDQSDNEIYVSGDTYSTDFPVTPCGWQQTLAGGASEDGWVAHFTPNGNLSCASYVGGPSATDDEDMRIAIYGCYVYMTGHTSGSYPTTANAWQPVHGGSFRDAFVAQLYKSSCGFDKTTTLTADKSANNVCNNTPIDFTSSFLTSCDTTTATYNWSFPGAAVTTSSLQNPTGITYPSSGNYIATVIATTPCDTATEVVNIIINNCGGCVNPPVLAISSQTNETCSDSNGTVTVSVNGGTGTAPFSYTWSNGDITATADSLSVGNYQVIVTDAVIGCADTLGITITNSGTATNGTDVITNCNPVVWLDGNTYSNNNNSATHTIVGGASNGCDSIITLDFTLNNATNGTDVVTNCSPIVWLDGITYSANNNTATHTLVGGAINGCDSVLTLDFTLNSATNGTDVITDCNPITWLDGITYSANNNTATHTLVGGAANGCDSIVTLDFTLNNVTNGTDVITDCNPVVWLDGNTYSANNNTAIHTLVGGAANGCDSIVTLDFTLNNPTAGTDAISSCGSITWIDGNTYSASNNTATHTITGGSANGCDSVVTLDFTLNNPTTGTDVLTSCTLITWLDGNTYSANNNTATHILVGGAANGCDSIVTLDFTLNNATSGTDVITSCGPITWLDGITYSSNNNTATHTLVGGASNGCDSVITLDFTLNTFASGNDVITDCNPIVWIDGNTYSASNNIATHTITGGSVNGCDSVVTLDFTLLPAYNITENNNVCSGDNYTYPDGTTNTNITVDESHISNLTSVFGCDSIVTTNITVNLDSVNFSYNPNSYCLTDPNPTPTNLGLLGGTYSIDNAGVINPTTGEVNITASGADTYTITYTTNGTCPNSQAITFTIVNCVFPLPIANFTTSNTTLCAGDCIDYTDLSTSSVGGVTAWSWNFTGADNPFNNNQHPTGICYNTPGTYPVTLTVTDANGINDTTFTNYITVNPCTLPTAGYTVSDSNICIGDCVDFTDQSSAAISWQWTFNGGTPSTSTDQHPTDICFNTVGNYTIKQVVTNTYGVDSATSSITVNALPIISAGEDVNIDLGESTPLSTTGSTGTYQWTPPTGLDCINCPHPTAKPEETITYTVIIVDANGCSATDQVTVIVDYETIIYIPNIFSPNGDGNNDKLYVRGKGIRDFNFVVYDRWGEKVFETSDLNKGWNGTFRGEPMNKAVFVYYLTGTFVDGNDFEQKGDVTLIR